MSDFLQVQHNSLEEAFIFFRGDLYTQRGSLAGVLAALGDAGHKNRRNKAFSRSQIHAMLTNPFYKGELSHGEMTVIDDHNPIISANLFGRVQNALRKNRKR
jgi:hypothetical protein|tara:strand:- start:1083 stop:1388 length:306 start_codon:yes stop_codon:yes gene_type:complete